jgi:hypothetical protein
MLIYIVYVGLCGIMCQTRVVIMQLHSETAWPYGLMDKALVFGTKDCRFESC